MSRDAMRIVVVLALALIGAGCGNGDGGGKDAAGDTAGEGLTDTSANDTDVRAGEAKHGEIAAEVTGDGDGEGDGAGGDQIEQPAGARAFVIESDVDLLPGRDAVGRVGDFRIENGKVSAVIGNSKHSIWGPYGGGVLDFTVAGGEDYFEEQFPTAGFLRGVRTESVVVASDGSDGEAIVRVTGRDGPIPLVASVVSPPPAGVEVVVEYVLRSDSDCLEIRTTVKNVSGKDISAPVGDGVVFSESGDTFGSGAGFNVGALLSQGSVDYLGSDLSTVSYLLAPLSGGEMSVALSEQELNVVFYGSLDLADGGSGTLSRCLYAVSGRSVGALERYWESRGLNLATVTAGIDLDTEGYDFGALRLEISREGEFSGAAGAVADGTMKFRVPGGKYSATLAGPGVDPLPTSWEASMGGTVGPLTLDPPDPARIDVQISDKEGKSLPARIIAQPGKDAAFGAPRVALVPNEEGKTALFLKAGEYTIQGTRGPEWSYCRTSVSGKPGEAVAASCSIQRELDVSGWVPADLHTHSEFSIDSHILRETRVRADIAEGLRFWSTTEHDVFSDFGPVVEALGVQDLIATSVGNEVSPVGRHFNGLGCSPEPEQMFKYFVVPWVGFDENGEVTGFKPSPEVWKSMHEDFHCRIVQVNHPRDGQGYLDFVHYDPAIGLSSAKPGEMDWTFDAMEIWNSNDSWGHVEGVLTDWYSFLNRGHNVIATGNADTHTLEQWAGQPRNVVQVAGEMTPTSFYDALQAHRSQVTGAPFIDFSIEDAGLGSTVVPAEPGAVLQAHIRVSASSWVPLQTARLIGNGTVVQEWPLAEGGAIERLDVTVEISPAADTWYHVVAFDPDTDLAPVYPGRTSAAITNPIWVDTDGKGFTPPIVD